MSDLSSLLQGNWYALATLFIQLAFLTAGVWFARDILRTMRAFQEQIGALLRLTITGATDERQTSSASPKKSVADAGSYWLAPSGTEAASLPVFTESGASRFGIGRRVIFWLQAPMNSAGVAPWRRILTWLQAPAGH